MTTHTATKPEEIWEQIGRVVWKELPPFLRPEHGEVFLILKIHQGKLANARGKVTCGVRFNEENNGEVDN